MPPGPPMPPAAAAAAAAASPPPLRLPPGAAEVPLAVLLVPLAALPAESPLASGAAAASGPGGLGSAAAAAAAGMAIMPFICRGWANGLCKGGEMERRMVQQLASQQCRCVVQPKGSHARQLQQAPCSHSWHHAAIAGTAGPNPRHPSCLHGHGVGKEVPRRSKEGHGHACRHAGRHACRLRRRRGCLVIAGSHGRLPQGGVGGQAGALRASTGSQDSRHRHGHLPLSMCQQV